MGNPADLGQPGVDRGIVGRMDVDIDGQRNHAAGVVVDLDPKGIGRVEIEIGRIADRAAVPISGNLCRTVRRRRMDPPGKSIGIRIAGAICSPEFCYVGFPCSAAPLS